MKYLFVVMLSLGLVNCATAGQESHESRIQAQYVETFRKTPSVDTERQCRELKAHYSKAFPVVIPACVALGLDAYDKGEVK